MKQNAVNRDQAKQMPKSGGRSCGCGCKGSNKFAIVVWVTLLLGGVALLTIFQRKTAAEAERLLAEAQKLYYEQGNLPASTDCLRQSAELGNVWAQLYYGERLLNGFGTDRNPTEAVKWLQKAANKNCSEAFFQLGVCYENGEGVERNLDRAEKWYRKASKDPGFAAEAQSSLERIEQLRQETPPAAY